MPKESEETTVDSVDTSIQERLSTNAVRLALSLRYESMTHRSATNRYRATSEDTATNYTVAVFTMD